MKMFDNRAQRTCRYCRVRKQRCDKALPKCSRCASKLVKCDYTEDRPTVAASAAGFTQPQPLAFVQDSCHLDLTSAGERQLLWAACNSHEQYSSMVESQSSLTALVRNVLNTGHDSFTGVSNAYFGNAHGWLPILNQIHVSAKAKVLDGSTETSDDAFALLFLSMYILNQPLCGHPNQVNNTLCRATRRFVFILETHTRASLLLRLQAGLLFAAHECGHAMFNEASSTLAFCLSLVRQLDLMATQETDSGFEEDNFEADRDLCWFCVILIDRAIVFSSVDYTHSLLIPSSQYLPLHALPKIAQVDYTAMSAVDRFKARTKSAMLIGDTMARVKDDLWSTDDAAAEELLHDFIHRHAASAKGVSHRIESTSRHRRS
ncbi:hypothetical protein BGZ63DRAFT_366014 [Mariannaea sp. PMI_226]|nr:hypothetical protein BGZ63DRAFT_366014 [Mariannaea sp. PMI_226]